LAASFANELDRCFLESWLGFERSLGFVLLHTRVAAVLQDKTSGAQDRETAVKDWLQILRAELQTPNLESVLYQGGRRYVCRVRPTTPAAVSSPVKPGGTYLVTGGCGGLGLLFARHFAETHPLNLVLTGRSPLDREKKSKIKALEDLGSRVLYLQADVSAASRMKEELNRAKERFGDIHGVVHAAGIQGRQTLFEKDFDAFQKVIEPKIRGTLVLDELLQDEPLDFTCYFSSSSAILGDFGSCDYAIGSRFQMAYAHYRAHLQALGQRRGKTIAINWPLWQEGGMGFTDARMTEMVLESSGQGFLQTRDGLALFDRLLAQDYPQHLVIVGQPGRVHRFLGLTEDRPAGTPPGISGASSGTRSEKREGLSLEQQLQRDLQEHIGQVLKLPVERLRTDQILADFGFDSIRLTELASRLTGYYHIEITPSVFFGHSTIEKLVRYFLTQHEEAIYEFYREGEAGEAAPAAPGWSESQKSGFAVKGDNHGVPGPLEPIAVIGMSGRFPLADTVEEFWRNLAEGKDCIREIPAERWDWRQYSREQGRAADIINCKWGGFLTGIDRFDPLFFEIAPKEAGFMDPKQRLFLEEAWHALEDAGYMGERIRGSLCGVYAGVEEGEYGFLKGESGQVYNSQNATLSARIAYTLDLKGPNFALTAACSSGLVAVHQACLALRHGECEIALAGGIHLMISPRLYVELNRLGLLSPEGKCRVFDWRANGLVPGEAAVVLVLKPLSRAIADKDHIYGCIKASGVNYDGKTNGITAPNPLSQAELIQGIYNKYHIDPAHIQYVLAHSTGSKLGDSLEIEAFTAAFGKYTDLKKFCSIGSIKPLIGHTFAASGIVSLIGMLMAMKHRIIPGLPYFESPNEHIDFKKSPFRVHQENQPWTAVNHRPRVGVIGTTGMSGTNAHAVIEEYLPPPGETGHTFFSPSSQVVVLSAWSPERLQAAVRQMLDFLRQESTPGARLGDIAYTLQIGREAMKERVALVVSSKQELSQRLETFLSLPPGDFPVNKIFTGSSDAPGAGSVEPVPSGKEPKLLVREALAERDPEPLARLWVKGTPVPWEQWHKNQPVRVISLPTYPFKKRRCWFSAGQRDYPGEKPGMTPDTAALAEMLKEDHIPYNKSSKNITAAIPHEAAPQPGTGLGERDESQEPGASLESLQGIFVTVLGLQPEELEEASTFKELGVSSINAVELVEAINKEFNLHLPTSMMLACNNLEAVAAHIENARRAVKSVDQTFQTFDSLAGKPEDIAIIGLSCRCAGARGQEEFWELVSQGKSSIKEIKNKSWLDFFRFNSKTRTPTRYGALEDQEYFDPLFFNISPKEAEAMDVAQRIILEEIYKALEDSGYSPSRLREQAVGTIIGTMGNTSNLADENFSHFALLGSDTSILSSRIAYFLDLKGPALAVNTACSSSLVAIDIACQKLKIHDIDLAIAGGITIFTHPGGFIPMHQAGMLSPTGECRPFDQEANGTVVGDGVGIVILKRFSEARRDNDPIYGIIRGSGTNQDGQTSGITVPNFLAQSQLEESIYRKNQICVDDLQYIEAHGTGTKLGDPIEVHALSHSFSQFTARKGFCALGSLKANIGHTTAAAGVLGLIKVLLSLKNRQIPPALNFTKKNEHIDFENSPFFVNTSLKDWPPNSRGSRLAAVSSFGFSGTNAHLVVEEGPAVSTSAASRISESIPGVLTISAENEAILRQYARDIREFLRTHRDIALEDFFYTFQVGREAMSCRLALVAGNKEKLPEQLEQFLGGQVKKTVGIYMGTVSKKESLDLGDTAEGKEFLQQLARHHQAAKLAQLWVKGNTIDWESLYRAGSARRLAGLPTYPFARERWRVPGSDIAAGGRQMAIAAAAAYLHPLLHGNTSDFREQRFSSTFTGREFFLADHMVKGQPVLPGVAYLEMVRAAVEIASASPAPGQAGIRLKNVVWIRPLVVTHQPVRVHIALFPDDRGEITFEIYGGPAADGQEPVVYCQGSALPGSGRKVKPLDLQALAAECNRASLSAHQCLAAFRTMGIDYGPAHQGIEQVYVGERQVLAKLSLPSAAAETPDQFILHPSLMDSAWQASIGLVMGPGDSPFPEGSAGLKPTLPFALQELEIFSPCTPAMWALLRLAGGSPAGDKVRKLDIHLSDETGKICVRLKGLSARVWEPAGNPAQQQGSLLNEQPGTPDPTLPAAPAAAGDLLQEKALHYFKYLLAPIINLPVDRIDADAPMEKYGIDSIMIVQLNNQLEKIFGSLSKTLFFEYRDLRELTGYFLEFHRDRLMGLPGIREEAGAVSVGGSSALETMRQKSVPRSPGRRDFASWRSRARGENSTGALDIAIIGLSGRYPQAGNTREFWENLREGKDCITEIPADRWDHSLYFDRDRNKPGKTYSKWGGFLDGVDRFDSLFFNISPLEAELMDPQERLFLECVYETLEDAGYTRETLALHRGFGLSGNVGVYVGVMYEEYQFYGVQEQVRGRPMAFSGNPSSIANRVSYFFNFHGPSMAVDTMCSSSLTAIYLGCQSLQRGECELAVAGGVNVSIHPNKYLLLAQGRFVSGKGRCESFGQGGDGFVPGEGVGAVLLKPLSEAVIDGDHIYGIIKAAAINHGGKTNGYTVPNPNAQASVIGRAFKQAGIHPRTVSYLEAHGTGTFLGDPVEITGLTKAFGEYTKDNQFCHIGSVKSNIGHCESAAGIAGLTKVLLQLRYGQLVPSLHAAVLNPNIDFSNTPFVVQQRLAEWKPPQVEIEGELREYPRIAGISSFGAGGSNAHLVIQEYIPGEPEPLPLSVTTPAPAVIVLSAKKEEQLRQQAQRLLGAITTPDQPFTDDHLGDIAYTLQLGREALEERLAMTVKSLGELREKLQGFLEGGEGIENLYRGRVKENQETLAGSSGSEAEAFPGLWVKGLAVDWNKLYVGNTAGRPRRVSLPTYPFARQRCWVPGSGTDAVVRSPAAASPPAAAPREDAPASSMGTHSTLMLAPVWDVVPAPEGQIFPPPGGNVVIVGGTREQRSTIRQFYPHGRVLNLRSGDSVKTMIKKLEAYAPVNPIDHIAWIAPSFSWKSLADDAIIQEQDRGVLSCFRLIKALLHLGYGSRVLGWSVITVQAQSLHQNDAANPAHAGLHGLVGSLAKEYPQWKIRLIDLEDGVAWPIAEIFTLPPDPLGNALLHRNRQWYRQQLIPLNNKKLLRGVQGGGFLEKSPPGQTKYKPKGVYVVIGGAGGIGEAWSEYMIRAYQARIIWIGRRPKDAAIEAKLARLAALGPAPHYIAADATRREPLQQAYEEIKQRYAHVNGVIHSAIVLLDKSLANMEEEQFQAAFSAKAAVSVRIAQVFPKDLDFVLFFSSLLAFTKNPGQSNYASGCTFMDAFAHRLAREWPGSVKTMNWGYWGSVGVVATNDYRERMTQAGIGSIEPPEAMEALETLLAAPMNQMALIKTTRPLVME
jgi:acyl transferase domain-containing protein